MKKSSRDFRKSQRVPKKIGRIHKSKRLFAKFLKKMLVILLIIAGFSGCISDNSNINTQFVVKKIHNADDNSHIFMYDVYYYYEGSFWDDFWITDSIGKYKIGDTLHLTK